MVDVHDSVRSSSRQLDMSELLSAPVASLLGVSDAAKAALLAIGIQTVFDLGSSLVFALAEAAIRPDWSRLGQVPADIVTTGATPIKLDDVGSLPLERLHGLNASDAAGLAAGLGIESIGDLAAWPPRQIAKQLLSANLGDVEGAAVDTLAERLRPALGEFPTERIFFEKLLMFGSSPTDNLQALVGGIDLTTIDSSVAQGGVSVGAVVTMSQSWFAQGVALGHMIHSLALAPGEATRIAVVDWSRRTSAFSAESINESEQIDDSTTHSRAVSEIQSAVADEMQRGGSMSYGHSKSSSKGSNASGSLGGGVAGMIGSATGALGFSIGGSTSHQSAESRFNAFSSSWSIGERSTSASLAQNVNDRTEQQASSVRSRRASAVREVSQSEHEEISTRVVANYNHMYALTVQYYEVVQIYRVIVRPHEIERVLFIPFDLIDFSGANALDLVARYRDQLLDAALTPRASDLIMDPVGRIDVRSAIRVESPLNTFADLGSLGTRATALARTDDATAAIATDNPPTIMTGPPIRTVIRTSRGPIEDTLPGQADLVRVSFEGVTIGRVKIELADSTSAQEFDVPDGADITVPRVKLSNVSSVLVASRDGTADSGTITLHCEIDGSAATVSSPVDLGAGTAMQRIVFIDADPSDRGDQLRAHLQSNRAYYTRSIMEGLDAAALTNIFSRFSWSGKPLVDIVEPTPIAIAGNYLVVRAPTAPESDSGLAGKTWGDLLDAKNYTLDTQDVRLVPVPTGGVFAEAVLGRSNAAEKLDLTRFWNWQDSPIPLQPTEIAPISAESRQSAEDLKPGALGAPVVNVMTPTSLPDPSGLASILGAISNGNMFRDMSGLSGTQAIGQTISGETLGAATEAGQIASDNFKTATGAAVEYAKTAADMWKTYHSSGSGGGGGGGGNGPGANHTVSAEGARINQGRDMDERGLGTAKGLSGALSGTSGRAMVVPGGGGDTGSGMAAGGNGADYMSPYSYEAARSDAGAGMPSLMDTLAAAGVPAILASATTTAPVLHLKDEELKEYLEKILDGTHVAGTVGELVVIIKGAEHWPTIEAVVLGVEFEAAESILVVVSEIATDIGYVATIALTFLLLYEAFTTGVRIQRKAGFCFGVMWEALGLKDTPQQFEDWAPNTAKELQDAWQDGVNRGRQMCKNNVKTRNRILLRVAYETLRQKLHGWTSPEGRVLNEIWEQAHGEDVPETHLAWIQAYPKWNYYDAKLDDDLQPQQPAPTH